MDGASRAAGVGAPITLNGRTFTVKGRGPGYQGAVEARIRALRGDPLTKMVEACQSCKDDPAMLDRVSTIFAEKFRNWNMATYADYDEFLRTPRGQAFSVWWAIKHNENPPTVEQVEFWLGELASEGEMQDKPVKDKDGAEVRDNDTGEVKTERQWVSTGWKKIREIINAIDFADGIDPLGN